MPFEVGGSDVVEHQGAAREVAAGEAALDPGLALARTGDARCAARASGGPERAAVEMHGRVQFEVIQRRFSATRAVPGIGSRA